MKCLKLFLTLTLLTGVLYPALITGIGQLAFKEKANGSLCYIDGKVVGSKLIAQKFQGDKYFWPRPSATDYDTLNSGGSNLSPTSAKLQEFVKKQKEHGFSGDMLYTSGSGLDPHISFFNVLAQQKRVSEARGKDIDIFLKVQNIADHANVLELNIALDTHLQSNKSR